MTETTWSDDSLRLIFERYAGRPVTPPPSPWQAIRNARRRNERLAERLLPKAQELVCLVRDEGPDSIGEWLAGLSKTETQALAVILAAMVPDDKPVDELLAWIQWDSWQGLAARLRKQNEGEAA
jgi:hypothetical protein